MTPPTATDTHRSTSDENPDPELQINGIEATPLGGDIDVNNVTVAFRDGALEYRAGVAAEVLALTDEYEERTAEFERKFDAAYRFRVHDDDEKPWFHKADFWPYTDDSARNLHHHIRYAYTHQSDTSITISAPIDRDEIAYPFSEATILTFFDPVQERIRVFGADNADARPASDVANRVFQPDIHLYAAVDGELIEITLQAKAYEDPMGETEHDVAEIDSAHITRVSRATIDYSSVTWERTGYSVTGDVWEIVEQLSADMPGGFQPGRFNSYHALFLRDEVETPDR